MEVSLDALDGEAVVVKQGLPFPWKELAMSQRNDPPLLGMKGGLELGRHEKDLPNAIVVVALPIFDHLASPRIPESRGRIRPGGGSQEIGERRHGEVRHKEPPGGQMRANAREKSLHVIAHVEVERGVERAHDEGEAAAKTDVAHVAAPHFDACSNVRGLGDQTLAKIREHGRRVIDARDVNPVPRHGESDPAIADPIFENRAAKALGEAYVELYVVDPPSIRRGVVVGVGIVRERARFELPVTLHMR
jgi:hypothetical protein